MTDSRYDQVGIVTDTANAMRRSLRAGASLLALGTLLAASGAYAQDAAPGAHSSKRCAGKR